MNLPEFHTQHILVVDDDEDDRMFFEEVVKELPYLVHVTVARDGEEAIKTLLQLPALPDVIFLDLNMPKKNGMDCLKEIKQNQKLKSIPVIIFSTSSYPSMINQAYDAGAYLYIRKANNFFDFKKSIQYVLSINWKKNISRPPKEEFVLRL
jgi:CheY-like chemotaxis protein